MANFINGVSFKLNICLLIYGVLFLSAGGLCQSVPAVYIFGDSLVDVGNNNYLSLSIFKANFPHNGVDFPTGEATGRFSNGKNTADFLAEKVGLPTAQPYLSLVLESKFPITGVNFASGGAGLFDRTGDIFKQVIPMSQQVEYYSLVHGQLVQQLGVDGARIHLSKSLFMIVIGGNDLFHYFRNNSKVSKEYTPQQYVDLMASTIKQFMQRLYGMDARKFVVTGVAVIGCCPSQRKQTTANECNGEANYWSTKYNDGLKALLQDLKSELSDINYSHFDTYGAMDNIIQDPQAYGFAEIKDACCGFGNMKADLPCIPIATYCSNRRDHLFWDRVHPTEAVSSLFADLLYNGSQKFTFPINVEQLVKL
ncbi:GDSL esterase/lipase At5g55050-like [Bidens hawaiensis]|uniref:GDSL esterase/lipase At5g55050-like n=1 Tax=Bidens hawaiensis TaxID=980011 RepID=UPI0040496100